MKKLRTMIITGLLLLLSAPAVFADIAPIPEPKSGGSLLSKILPIALGVLCGVLLGRYLARKRRGK